MMGNTMNILTKIVRKIRKEKYTKEEETFITYNKPVWDDNTMIPNKEKKILVYVAYNPARCIIETMLLAKKIEEKYQKQVVVLIEDDIKNAKSKSRIYQSFNVHDFVNCNDMRLKLRFRCFCNAVKIFLKIQKGRELLELKYKGVDIGENLYDAILRDEKAICTVENIKIKYFPYFYRLFKNMEFYDELLKNKEYDTVLFTDADYVRCAIVKMAIKYDCTLYTCNTGRYVRYHNTQGYKVKNVNILTRSEWEEGLNTRGILSISEKYLKERLLGITDNQFDKYAFYKKEKYSKKQLMNLFAIKEDRKNVVVAAHIFSDVAHYGFDLIYQDYYWWLIETLRILNTNTNVNVFLKIHPSTKVYNEECMVEQIINKEALSNVFLLPNDFSTASIKDIADYIVTCQGTMGLEMACFGIPVFTAGKGYYYGYDIDTNSSSKEEYEKRLLNITSYEPLSNEQQERAKILLYLIWGLYGKSENVHSTIPKNRFGDSHKYWEYPYSFQYQVINENLRNGAKMKDEYYDNILEYIVDMK